MTWVGYTVGMQGEQVRKIQHELVRKYAWARTMGVQVTGTYDQTTADAIAEFQRRVGLPVTGIANFDTQVRLGAVELAPPTLTTAYTVPGTWAAWNDGPPAWTAWKLNPARFRQQGVGFNTAAFLQPDPQHCYVEAITEGTAELLRLALPDPNPKVWLGYSMGADVVVHALLAWPAERRKEIKTVITFGSPGRPPGLTKLGNDPGGSGISGAFTPEWARDRTWDFTIDGDMYANAVGLLPFLYQILIRLELSIEFATYLFQMLTTKFGDQLLGTEHADASGAGALARILGLVTPGPVTHTSGPVSMEAILANLVKIIPTIAAALKFVSTNAHFHYHDQPLFNGLTGVDRAVQIISEGRRAPANV